MTMNRMSGMDTEEGRNTSRNMDQHASAVGQMVGGISNMLGSVVWVGSDAKRFHSDWNGSFAPQANGAVESIQQNAQVLRQHADRQDSVSQ